MDFKSISLSTVLALLGALFVLIALFSRIPTPWGWFESSGKTHKWVAGLFGALLLGVAVLIHVGEVREDGAQVQTASPPAGTTTPSPAPATISSSASSDPVFAQTSGVDVLSGTKLSSGFDIGVDSSEKLRDWLNKDTQQGCLTMVYPSGQQWGSVFITVGKPKDPPRPARDFSEYRTLVIEMKSDKKPENIGVGIKSNAQPDDGSEPKVTLNVTPEWKAHTIQLTQFAGTDLKNLYVVTEFVFNEPNSQTISVRSIKFAK